MLSRSRFIVTPSSTTEIYTLSLHDALPIFTLDQGEFAGRKSQSRAQSQPIFIFTLAVRWAALDRKSTRLNSSHRCISYAVFCLKKKNRHQHKVGRPPEPCD